MTGGLDETALEAVWRASLGGEVAGKDPTVSLRPSPGLETASVAVTAATLVSPGSLTTSVAGADGAATKPDAGRPGAPLEGGSYSVIEELGRGGMGIVYRARQPRLDREVALKRVLPGRVSSEMEARFVAEARTTGFLDHPNIVPVHELGRTPGGDLFLAMKLVGGVPWRDLLHPKKQHEALAKSYDRDKHLAVLLAVSNAVAFAHSRHIIHRDLKPENVMVGEFGEVLVMDWGLAVCVSEALPEVERAPHRSRLGPTIAGTPCYMAPEMAEGKTQELSPASDVFLLGAILHEILTGRAPHPGNSVLSVLKAAARADPPELPGDVPKELAQICRRALARDPAARFADATAFKRALEDHLSHRESTKISEAAEVALERCERGAPSLDPHALYAELAYAVSAMRQALVLWPENEHAKAGERRARLVFAGVALERGDTSLAETLLSPSPPEDEPANDLRAKAALARHAAGRRERLRRVLIGVVIASVIIIVATLASVRAERDRALEAEARERAERERAVRIQTDAERSAALARTERDRAQEALAHTFEVRGATALAEEDLPLAAVLFAEANRCAPRERARANVAFCLARVPRLETLVERGAGTFVADDAGLTFKGDDAWPGALGEDFAALSPDGRHFLTLSRDAHPSARVRRLPSGELVGTTGPLNADTAIETLMSIGVQTSEIMTVGARQLVAFSAAGHELFARTDAPGLQRFRIEGWERLPAIDPPALYGFGGASAIRSLATSDDEKTLYMGCTTGLFKLNLADASLRRIHWFELGTIATRLECVPRGEDRLAIALSNGSVVFYDLEDEKLLPESLHHRDQVVAWDVTARGDRWVTVSRDGTVRAWTLPALRPLPLVVRTQGAPRSARFSKDGARLGVASALGVASTWRVPERPSVQLEWPSPSFATSMALAASGTRLVVPHDGALVFYDTVSGKRRGAKLPPLDGRASELALPPAGEAIAYASSGSVVVADLERGKQLARFACAPGTIDVSPLSSGRWLARLREPKGRGWVLDLSSGAATAIGLATASRPDLITLEAGTLRITDAAGARVAEAPGEESLWIEASHDGRRLASLGADGRITIRSLPSLAVEWSFETKNTHGTLAFVPGDETLVLLHGSSNLDVVRWDLARRIELKAPRERLLVLVEHRSPSRRLMVLTSAEDAWQLWDSAQAKVRARLMPASVCRFSADETRLALAGTSRARVFDTATGAPAGPELALPGAADEVRFIEGDRVLLVLCRRVGGVLFDIATGERIGSTLAVGGAPRAFAGAEAMLPLTSSWDAPSRKLAIGSMTYAAVFTLDFLAPADEPPGEISRRVAVATGLDVDERGEVRVLSPSEWRALTR